MTRPTSALTFPSDQARYLLLRYQLFSASTDVTAQVHLNGTFLGETTFPRNRYAGVTEMGGFSRPGHNQLTIDYRCGGQTCSGSVSQYWTDLEFRPPVTLQARERVGLTAQRWNLNVPDSPLKIEGATPLLFDGANYFRQVKGSAFRLSWTEKARPLNVTFQVEADEPVRVINRVAGQVVSVFQGNGLQTVSSSVSLLGFGDAQALEVDIQCLRSGTGCATLYFPRVTVIPDQVGTPIYGWAMGLAAVLTLLAFGFLLGLWPAQARVASG